MKRNTSGLFNRPKKLAIAFILFVLLLFTFFNLEQPDNNAKEIIELKTATILDTGGKEVHDYSKELLQKDNSWITFYANQTLQIEFTKELDKTKDIKFYTKNNLLPNATLELYDPDTNNLITTLPITAKEKYHKLFLQDLTKNQSTFNVKLNSLNPDDFIEIDHIIDPSISACGTLTDNTEPNILTQDVTDTDTCFELSAHHIILDCQGYNITYGTTSATQQYGVNTLGWDNFTAINCEIHNGGTGQQNHGIQIDTGSIGSRVINSTITVTGSSSRAINILGSNDSQIINSSLYNTGSFGVSVYLTSSLNNTIFNSSLYSRSASGQAIYLSASDNNFLLNSTLVTTSTVNPIQLLNSDYNTIDRVNVSSGGYGLTISSAYYNNITRSRITSFYSTIFANADGDFNLFENNTLISTGTNQFYSSVSLSSADNNIFYNNLMNQTRTSGGPVVYLDNNADNNTFEKNILDMARTSFTADGYSSAIFGNRISGVNVTHNIFLSDTDQQSFYFGGIGASFYDHYFFNNTHNNDPIYYIGPKDHRTVFNHTTVRLLWIAKDNFTVNNVSVNHTDGMRVAYANNVVINDSFFVPQKRAGLAALHLRGAVNTTVNNTRLTTSQTTSEGIYLEDTFNNTIYNVTIQTSGSTGRGIYFDDANNNTISNSRITTTSTTADGLVIFNGDGNLIQYINISTGSADGVELTTATSNNVSYCRVSSSNAAYNTNSNSNQNNYFSHNYLESSGSNYNAVSLSAADFNTLHANVINQSSTSGNNPVLLINTAQNNTFTYNKIYGARNTFSETAGSGVRISGSPYNNFSHNIINTTLNLGRENLGLYVVAAFDTHQHHYFFNNTHNNDPIYYFGPQDSSSSFSHSNPKQLYVAKDGFTLKNVTLNQVDGIRVLFADDISIQSSLVNITNQTNIEAIYLDNANNVTIQNTTTLTNKGGAFSVYFDTTENSTIRNSNFESKSAGSLYFVSSESNQVLNSTIYSFGASVYFSNAHKNNVLFSNITNIGSFGIQTISPSNNNTFAYNRIISSGSAISLNEGGKSLTNVSYNYLEGNSSVSDTLAINAPDNVTIAYNIINNSGGGPAVAEIFNSDNITFIYNNLSSSRATYISTGMLYLSSSKNGYFAHNRLIGETQTKLTIAFNAENNSFNNNYFGISNGSSNARSIEAASGGNNYSTQLFTNNIFVDFGIDVDGFNFTLLNSTFRSLDNTVDVFPGYLNFNGSMGYEINEDNLYLKNNVSSFGTEKTDFILDFNKTMNVSFYGQDCLGYNIYHNNSFINDYTTALTTNIVATQADAGGGSCGNNVCSNIQCNAGTLSFTVPFWSAFAIQSIGLVDGAAPAVTFLNPVNNSNFSTQIQAFNASVIDETALDSVIFMFPNNQTPFNKTAVNNSGNWNTNVDMNTLTEGLHMSFVFANDTSNNVNQVENVSFYVDRTPPIINILNPAINTSNSTVGIRFNVTDLHRFLNCSLYINNTLNTTNTFTPNGTNVYLVSQALNDAYYNATVTCIDPSGNLASNSSITILVDTLVPAVTLTNPTNSSNFSSGLQDVNATIFEANPKTILFRLDNSTGRDFNLSLNNISGNWNNNLNISALVEGTHSAYIYALDPAGNLNDTENINFIVDRTPPVVNNQNVSYLTADTTPTLWVNFTDTLSAVANCSLFMDGAIQDYTVIPPDTNTPLTPTTALTEGAYLTNFTCVDYSNNSATSSTITVTIDLFPLFVNIISPANNSNLSTEVQSFNASIQEANPDTIIFVYDNATGVDFNKTPTNRSGNWNVSLNISTLTQGRHLFRVFANDSAGNTDYAQNISFTVDRDAPNVTLLNTSLTTSSPLPSVWINTTDNFSIVTNCSLFIAGTLHDTSTVINTTPTMLTASTPLGDGNYLTNVTCTDYSGNQGNSTTITLTVNLAPLTVVITNPANNSNLSSGNQAFNASVLDTNVDTAIFQFTNATGNNFNITATNVSGNWNTLLNVDSFVQGQHQMRVFANDTLANTNTNSFINFIVDRDAPNVTLLNTSFSTTDTQPNIWVNVIDNFSAVTSCDLDLAGTTYSTTTVINNTNTSLPVNTTLAAGIYPVNVSCTDYSGNQGNATGINVTIAAVSTPAPTASSGGGGSSSSGGGGGTIFECRTNADCPVGKYCVNHQCLKIFDLKIVHADSPIEPGDQLDFSYFIKGIAAIEGDVTLDFWLEDVQGNKITSGRDIIFVGTFEQKTEQGHLALPSSTPLGQHRFAITLYFDGYEITAHRDIEVVRQAPLHIDIITQREQNLTANNAWQLTTTLQSNKDKISSLDVKRQLTKHNSLAWFTESPVLLNKTATIQDTIPGLTRGEYTLEVLASDNGEVVGQHKELVKISGPLPTSLLLLALLVLALLLLLVYILYYIWKHKDKDLAALLKRIHALQHKIHKLHLKDLPREQATRLIRMAHNTSDSLAMLAAQAKQLHRKQTAKKLNKEEFHQQLANLGERIDPLADVVKKLVLLDTQGHQALAREKQLQKEQKKNISKLEQDDEHFSEPKPVHVAHGARTILNVSKSEIQEKSKAKKQLLRKIITQVKEPIATEPSLELPSFKKEPLAVKEKAFNPEKVKQEVTNFTEKIEQISKKDISVISDHDITVLLQELKQLQLRLHNFKTLTGSGYVIFPGQSKILEKLKKCHRLIEQKLVEKRIYNLVTGKEDQLRKIKKTKDVAKLPYKQALKKQAEKLRHEIELAKQKMAQQDTQIKSNVISALPSSTKTSGKKVSLRKRLKKLNQRQDIPLTEVELIEQHLAELE